MAQNEKLLARIRELLASVPKVAEKKMFGGTAFMVNDKMCVTVRDQRIMCRIDPALHDEAIKQKGCSTMSMKGREYKGYVLVHEDCIQTKKALEYWITLALDYNKTARSSKKK